MAQMIRPMVAGNWKMNGSRASLDELALMSTGFTPALREKLDLMICPPATLVLAASQRTVGSGIAIGGQDCHANDAGAHTGDLSAGMLFDAGATAVIVGHSERRADHGESDATVRAKAEAARRNALIAIVCVGETRADREAGKTLAVVRRQLKGSIPDHMTSRDLVVAYEPVWAIGTGLTPTAGDVAEVHAMIRQDLRRIVGKEEAEKVRILYGGSVKSANIAEIMKQTDVDGALIGGASLDPEELAKIAKFHAQA